MRPTTSATNKTNLWNSPIPYLFGSLATLIMLIAVALILSVCSYKKQSSSSSSSSNSASDDNASEKPAALLKVLDPEPKIVVIMAGDEKPSFLAMPAVPSTVCRCDDQV